jgi:L-aminopeptidase/D-esterase-like protein
MNDTLTAIDGVLVGHAHDAEGLTGCTAVLFEQRYAVSAAISGGGLPGTYNIGAALQPSQNVRCDAIFLTGGSLYGLDAATGVRQFVEEKLRPLPSKRSNDPLSLLCGIVTGAVLFDLQVGSAQARPDAAMGYAAAANASHASVAQGNVGAGCGATVGKFLGMKQAMKGGSGSICLAAQEGFLIGALVAVNAVGNVFDIQQGCTLAGARHTSGTGFLEFADVIEKGLPTITRPEQNTVLGVIVTDVPLDSIQLTRIAQAGHIGLARAVRPAHTSFDGDTFFAVSTGQRTLSVSTPLSSLDAIAHLASEAVRLAIIRAVQTARSVAGIPGLQDNTF